MQKQPVNAKRIVLCNVHKKDRGTFGKCCYIKSADCFDFSDK